MRTGPRPRALTSVVKSMRESAGGEVGGHPWRGVQRQAHEHRPSVDDRPVAPAELGPPQRVIGARHQRAGVRGAVLI